MLAKPQQTIGIKLMAAAIQFLNLHFLLWSIFLRPTIVIDKQWVPKSFFFSSKQSTCIIRVQDNSMAAIFESAFFAAIALAAYYHASNTGSIGVGFSNSSLANFELSMMGVKQKYYWICYVPWIITFGQKWLQSIGDIALIVLSSGSIYDEANELLPSVAALILFVCVQTMLASEVIYMALQGWYAMKNINDENMLWEQRKSVLLSARTKM